MLLKVGIPVEKGNETVKDGSIGQTIQAILADIKPEAVYLLDDGGRRTMLIFFDMAEAADIPAVVEPFMQAFNASVELHPVMVPDDLMKGMPAAVERLKKYG
jgi:hypothetical protein